MRIHLIAIAALATVVACGGTAAPAPAATQTAAPTTATPTAKPLTATVELKDKDGTTVATAALTEQSGGVRIVLTPELWLGQLLPLARLRRRLGIAHWRTRPYTPRTNGKAERFIKTLQERWAYERLYRSSEERAAALAPFLEQYSHRRSPTLGGHTPL